MNSAAAFRALHDDPSIFVVVNVWDVASARAVAAVDGIEALATASHAIAAAHGFPDGEKIPLDLHLAAIERIAGAVDLPLSMDLEAGYGDPGETTRRAIAAGAVGANLEDQAGPFDAAVAAVAAVTAAGKAAGVDFVLNARTDVVLKPATGVGPEESIEDAIARGRAFLDAGAACVFVPGVKERAVIERLVAGIGERKISVLAGPGALPISELQELGVARASLGPWSYRAALTALQDVAAGLVGGGTLPASVRADAV